MRARGSLEPWRDEREARQLLGALADALVCESPSFRPSRSVTSPLTDWLGRHDLVAPFYFACESLDPLVAARLRPAALSVAATNRAHFDALERIEAALAAAAIPVVLLKGAALAHSAYGGPSRRPMSDLDLWIGSERIVDAESALRGLGYGQVARPSPGEVQLRPPGRRSGLVELHETAFRGYWVRWTASVDEASVWQRAVPVAPGRAARRLAAEDEVIHLACHLVTNHVAQAPLRGLLDLALVARSRRPDWRVVVERAVRWRVATAVWLALDRAERTIGVPGATSALERLRPPRGRRIALGRLASPRAILGDRGVWHRRPAFPFLCTDRARDAVRFVRRAVWPDRAWLATRYGAGAGRLTHVRALVGSGRV